MARIAGVDLPREKRVEIGLTYIYGIGRSKSNEILSKTGINPDTRVRDLTDDEVGKLRDVIDKEYVVEGDVRREVKEESVNLLSLVRHIFAPVLIIRLLRSLINPVMRFLGQALVAWALEAPKRARRLPRNLLLRLPRKPQWNMD